jgi:hypothetical protein
MVLETATKLAQKQSFAMLQIVFKKNKKENDCPCHFEYGNHPCCVVVVVRQRTTKKFVINQTSHRY